MKNGVESYSCMTHLESCGILGSLGSTISLRHLPQKMTPSANRTISISSIMELEFSI
ncbi:MAG: hypothetical protein ACI9P5_004711 [Saprospiraceae bacterium]|jgi:hypothetical protein